MANIGRVEKQYTKTGALLEGDGDQILEINNEALKYGSYKVKSEDVVNELSGIKNRVSVAFQGKTKDEMIESINFLQNRCRDLGDNLQSFRTSLENLQEDVLQEERRQERIRKEKEEERKRKAANNK